MDFIGDVINLTVFDEKGNLVAKLDTLKKGELHYDTEGTNTYLGITDIAFRTEMLKQFGKQVEQENKTDFEKTLSEDSNETVLKFSYRKESPKFKLIADGIMYDSETNKVSNDFKVVVPCAKLTSPYRLEAKNTKVSEFDYVFKPIPKGGDAEIFEIRIKERN